MEKILSECKEALQAMETAKKEYDFASYQINDNKFLTKFDQIKSKAITPVQQADINSLHKKYVKIKNMRFY